MASRAGNAPGRLPGRLVISVLLLLGGIAMAFAASADRFAEERLRMVEEQIHRRGIDDPAVLGALSRVPRHLFVPDAARADAYRDTPIPIGHGQTISQP